MARGRGRWSAIGADRDGLGATTATAGARRHGGPLVHGSSRTAIVTTTLMTPTMTDPQPPASWLSWDWSKSTLTGVPLVASLRAGRSGL